MTEWIVLAVLIAVCIAIWWACARLPLGVAWWHVGAVAGYPAAFMAGYGQVTARLSNRLCSCQSP